MNSATYDPYAVNSSRKGEVTGESFIGRCVWQCVLCRHVCVCVCVWYDVEVWAREKGRTCFRDSQPQGRNCPHSLVLFVFTLWSHLAHSRSGRRHELDGTPDTLRPLRAQVWQGVSSTLMQGQLSALSKVSPGWLGIKRNIFLISSSSCTFFIYGRKYAGFKSGIFFI